MQSTQHARRFVEEMIAIANSTSSPPQPLLGCLVYWTIPKTTYPSADMAASLESAGLARRISVPSPATSYAAFNRMRYNWPERGYPGTQLGKTSMKAGVIYCYPTRKGSETPLPWIGLDGDHFIAENPDHPLARRALELYTESRGYDYKDTLLILKRVMKLTGGFLVSNYGKTYCVPPSDIPLVSKAMEAVSAHPGARVHALPILKTEQACIDLASSFRYSMPAKIGDLLARLRAFIRSERAKLSDPDKLCSDVDELIEWADCYSEEFGDDFTDVRQMLDQYRSRLLDIAAAKTKSEMMEITNLMANDIPEAAVLQSGVTKNSILLANRNRRKKGTNQ